MSLFLFHGFPSNNSLFSSQSPTPLVLFNRIGNQSSIRRKPIIATTIPARDRVIDFGRHKGRMLGTLPSKYLKWVSKNLRARDFEEWAKLADEVLQDPIYKDRLEWEFAEEILTGDRGSLSSSRLENSVSNLSEISERFGWDNDDKLAWKLIDFSLLGTSKGGRIPRRGSNSMSSGERNSGEFRANSRKEGKLRASVEAEESSSVRGRRVERRERQRLRRGAQLHKVNKDGDYDVEKRREQYENYDENVKKNSNPFPGREALLRRVLDNRRFL